MGLSYSRCDAAPAAKPGAPAPSLVPPAAAAAQAPKKVDYMDLPLPIKYEEIQREALMSLKPDLFEGMRFDFNKGLNQKFSLTHSIFMGSVEVPSQGSQTIKIPASSYEFGSILVDGPLLMIGKVFTDGRMTGRIKYDVTNDLSMKLQTQLTKEKGYSQVMLDVDAKGQDWQGQFKIGNGAFYGLNYIQSVTPALSMGGEAFWLGTQRKSGIGFAARHATDKHVGTVQVATTGLVSLTYVHNVSEKVHLATDFLYNWNSREATASIGYDYILRQCRLRGRVDSNGAVAAYLEERLNVGVNFVLSAEARAVDHGKKDYKFGFGMTVGE